MRVALLAAVLLGCPEEPDAPLDEQRLSVDDGFVLGANYPWHHYGHDFGRNSWGWDGVSVEADEVRGELVELVRSRAAVARWFVLADGRAGVDWEGERPIGLQAEFFADFDAALTAAEDAGILLLPTLLDFHWFAEAEDVGGVQLGGHAAIARDPALRQAFLDVVVAPIVDRYGAEPAVFAWDLINEPEWVLDGRGLFTHGVDVEVEAMEALVDGMTATVHARAEQPVTLGSGKVDWHQRYWSGTDLDLAQVHWYEPVALGRAAAEVAPGIPLLLGEVATDDPNLPATLDAALTLGYAGALPWSFGAQDDATDWDGDVLRSWAERHEDRLAR